MKAFLPMLALCFSMTVAQSQSLQPPANLSLFMEGSVSTNLNERDMAISPDGNEMYYTLEAAQNAFSTILYRHKLSDNKWSAPEVASFSGRFKDLEPAFSADGLKLFFSSNRPVDGKQAKDFDIWVIERAKDGVWSSPHNVGSPVNTEANEFYPSVARSGNLYFTSEYEKGVGKEDIYMCKWQDGKYGESVALDTAVNSKLWEFNAFVSPDEKFILFTSYGRKDDQGGGDLYISFRDAGGAWQPAKNVSMLNSPKLDFCPFVSFDQKILFFTSSRHDLPSNYEKPASHAALVKAYNGVLNGSENIYWMDFQAVVHSLK
jgi:hypothetical protein